MNLDRLKEFLEKVPATLMLLAYLGYLGFDYYSFTSDSGSALQAKVKDLEGQKDVYTKLEQKLKTLNEFVRSLDAKKSELRRMATELQDLKGSIPEMFDVSKFMEMTFTEAKKAGMKVESLIPVPRLDKEDYAEYRFNLTCRGLFSQVSVFLDRLSNVTEIVKVDSFSLTPVIESGKYTELNSQLEIKTYQYLGSKADTIAKRDEIKGEKATGAPTRAAPGVSPSQGGETLKKESGNPVPPGGVR